MNDFSILERVSSCVVGVTQIMGAQKALEAVFLHPQRPH